MPFFEKAEDCASYSENDTCCLTTCKRNFRPNQSIVVCSFCCKIYHPQCKGIIGVAKIKKAAESGWICSVECFRPLSNTSEDTNIISPSKLSASEPYLQCLPEIQNLIKGMNDQFSIIKSMISNIKDSQEFICNEFEEMKTNLKNIINENKIIIKKCDSLENMCKNQEVRIDELEYKMDGYQQRELNSNIIIDGLPESQLEPLAVTGSILSLLQCSDLLSEIVSCEYMSVKTNTRAHATQSQHREAKLIIKFKNNQVKNKVMLQKRKIKPKLYSNDINFDIQHNPIQHNNTQIYFRHHLTTFRYSLYREGIKIKKLHNYKYLWIQEGNILIRKTEGSPITRIKSQVDINKLTAPH